MLFFYWFHRKMAQTSKRQKSRKSEDREWGPWANLTGHLLISIIFELGLLDSVSIAGVCKQWSEIVEDNRKIIIERLSPLVLAKPAHAKKSCCLYPIPIDLQREYKTLLPVFWNRCHLVGLSCGFLILRDSESKFWLFNPITKKELHFPAVPQDRSFCLKGSVATLIYSTEISDNFLLVVNQKLCTMLIARRGGATWRTIPYKGKATPFVDITFFKNNVYVLTRDGGIGRLRVTPYLLLELMDVRNSFLGLSSTRPQFATSKNHLFMVSNLKCRFCPWMTENLIYKLDEANMAWEKVNDLHNEALFLSHMRGGCSAILDATKFGGRSNCIYYCSPTRRSCRVYSSSNCPHLTDCRIPEPRKLYPLVWYLPQLYYKRNAMEGSFEVLQDHSRYEVKFDAWTYCNIMYFPNIQVPFFVRLWFDVKLVQFWDLAGGCCVPWHKQIFFSSNVDQNKLLM